MEKFRTYTKREFLVFPECSEAEFDRFVRHNPKFIAKPVDGSQGQGIKVYSAPSCVGGGYSSLSNECSLGKQYVLEEFITQHSELDAFYDKSVNCIRVITVLQDKKVNILVANITFGSEYEIANASYGGITCEIDVDSGVIISDGGQFGHILFSVHPYSRKKFIGFQIPFWQEVIEMLEAACQVVPEVAYVGWDIAITPEGPVIIEGNTSPGYTYFQIPQLLQNNKGVMERYKPFL